MVRYDAEATRRRLIDAACAEFARYGVAGARVDRIGAAAGSNKAQIYYYFGSKDQLFDAVCEQALQQMEAEVPLRIRATFPVTLPAWSGCTSARPEIARLCTWQRLERGAGEPNPAGVAYARTQIDAIARAQKNGDLPVHFHPGFLLGLVLHLATGWVSVSPEFEAAIDVPDPGDRARYVQDAIRALLTPGRTCRGNHAAGDALAVPAGSSGFSSPCACLAS